MAGKLYYSTNGIIRSFLVVTVAIMLFKTDSVYAQSISLAEQEVPKAVIVISKDAAPTEKFAAQELKHYLDKMTGGSFSITDVRPESGNAIILGDTEYTRKVGIDVNKLNRDEFVIKAIGKDIFIAGKDAKTQKADIIFQLKDKPEKEIGFQQGRTLMQRTLWDFDKATLYGVYYFLENNLGVRWFFPGPEGETVPEKPSIEFNLEKPHNVKPHFVTRVLGIQHWPANLTKIWPHLGKPPIESECADLGWTSKRNRLWEIRHGGGSKIIAINHYPDSTRWKQRFAKDHPEYFALLANGKRDLPDNLDDQESPKYRKYRSHLCYSNPDVRKETLKDIDAFFSGKPSTARNIPMHPRYVDNKGWAPGSCYQDTFSILPHDSFKRCRCKECNKLFFEDLDYLSMNTDLVFNHVSKVAQEVQKKWPNKFITCLAYSSYSFPPQTIKKLPDNVIVGLCPGIINKPFNTITDKRYAQYIKLLKDWSAFNKQPLAVWLHFLYRWAKPETYCIPMYLPHQQGKMIKGTSKYANHAYIQLNVDSVFYDHMNRYITQKALWNPNIDVDALLDDYIKNYYGEKAYPVVKELLDDLEDTCSKYAAASAGRYVIYDAYLNKKRIEKYEKLIQKALSLTKGTKYEKHVKYLDKYLVQGIKKGYDLFKDKLKIAKITATLPVYPVKSEITIDGIIDEKDWEKCQVLDLVNNVDSKKTSWKTDIRILYDKENLYFSFDCFSPNIEKEMKDKKYEYVEIFIDDNYNCDSYQQILVNTNGEVKDWYFEGGGELGNSSWSSDIKKGIKIKKDGWSIEIAVPIKNLFGGGKIEKGKPWGINICRSLVNPPNKNEKWNTYSRLIVGRFSQPDLFAQMFFVEEPSENVTNEKKNEFRNGSFEEWGDKFTPTDWATQVKGKCRLLRDSAIVHTGKHSARMEIGDTGYVQLTKALMKSGNAEHRGRESLNDGKYKLTFYWYSTTGKIVISIRYFLGVENDKKMWMFFNPKDMKWIKTPGNRYDTLIGKPNTWNKTELEFSNDFEKISGYLIFYAPSKTCKGSVFVDDVQLQKIQ